MQPPTPREYGEAIIHLASVARHHTGGGEAAARILLSAYNHWEWSFSAGDIARFDDRVMESALIVLHGRARLGEPHHFVDVPEGDPETVFRDLWVQWRPEDQQ